MKEYAIAKVWLSVNAVVLIGHSALRLPTMNDVTRPATGSEITAMRRLLAQRMDERACGLFTGLYCPPNAAAIPREVAAVGRVVSEGRGTCSTHKRDESDPVRDSLRESAETAQAAKLRC